MVGLNFGSRAQSLIGAPNKPAPIDGNMSASQCKAAKMCWRWWWFSKLGRLPQIEKQHFFAGTALHAVGERYLKREATDWLGLFPTGWDARLDPDSVAFIQAAAEHAVTKGLWQYSPTMKVEEPIAMLVGERFLDHRGMPLLARADTTIDERGIRRTTKLTTMLDGSPLPSGYDDLPVFVGYIDSVDLDMIIPRIDDIKSAKTRRYTLSPARLATDLQLGAYAAWALARRQDAQQAQVRHLYFLKDPDASEPAFVSEAMLSVTQVRELWAEIIQIGRIMKEIREKVPVIVDPERPYNRVDNFKAIEGACDQGKDRIKEGCKAYGGCPMQDACFHRSMPAEVLKRLETPSMMSLVKRVTAPMPIAFGLNFGSSHLSTPPPAAKDTHMPFTSSAPSFPVGSDCYLLDQVNKKVQFRARILAHPKPGEAKIALWPHPDREPYWAALPPDYLIDMLISELMATPSPMAKVTGYHEELVNAGLGAGNEWKDMHGTINTSPVTSPPASAHPSPLTGYTGPAAPPQASDGFADTKISRPPRDAATPLGTIPLVHSPGITMTMLQVPASQAPAASKGQALAQQMNAAVAAEAANQVPAPAFEPRVGDVVEFLPTAHKFWAAFAGKKATVTDVSLGENQLIVSVNCEGTEYPDLQSGRFKLFSRPAPLPAKPAAPAATSAVLAQSTVATATSGGPVPSGVPVPQQTIPGVPLLPATLEEAQALVGKSVVFKAKGSPVPFNAPLAAVSDVGPTLLGHTHPWDTVERLSLMTPTDIPGAKPPKVVKLTAEQKKAAKAKEEMDKLVAAKPFMLRQAHALVEATVKGEGKVTKKAFEALLDMLSLALQHEQDLLARAGGAPAPVAAPSPATVEMAAALQAARDNLDLVAAQLGLA
jgi:hypothetical protein